MTIKPILTLLVGITLYCPLFSQTAYKQGQLLKGKASYYADKYHGRKTASGERFDMYQMTAAHKSLPFQSVVKVTNRNNNRSVELRINDRGPFVKGRIIDVSKGAAQKLGMMHDGVVDVEVEIISLPGQPAVANKKSQVPNGVKKPKAHKDGQKSSKVFQFASLPEGKARIKVGRYYNTHGKEIQPQGYGIQVAAYWDFATMAKAIQQLEAATGHPAVLWPTQTQKGVVFRLVLSEYKYQKTAKKELKKLRKMGYRDAFVRKYP